MKRSGILITCILLCGCVAFVYSEHKRGVRKEICLLELLCYLWSSSWRNFQGGSFADFPLSWFYIVGFCLMLLSLDKIFLRKSPIMDCTFLVLMMGIIPTVIAPQITEGISFYITLAFCMLVPLAIGHYTKVDKKDVDDVVSAFVESNIIAALFLIAQAAIQLVFNYNFVTGGTTTVLGGNRMMAELLFPDISSAMISFAAAAIVAIVYYKKIPYVKILILVMGIAFSSSRTGIAAFGVALVMYILASDMSKAMKRNLIVGAGIGGIITVLVYQRIRGVESITAMLDDSGRISGYIESLKVWTNHPLLGFGFSDEALAQVMGEPIPHFALLKMLVEGGILFFGVIVLYLFVFFQKGYNTEKRCGFWALLTTLLGSCFIPSIFEARFICIIMSIIMLERNLADVTNREKGTNYVDRKEGI